jgi:hypothetical protein
MNENTHPTAAEHYFFENNGYLVLENFLAPQHVSALVEALEDAITRRRDLHARGVAHTGMTQVNGADTRIFYILDDHPMFLDLLDYPALMPYVTGFLGPMAHFHASDAIWELGHKDKGNGKAGWHMDGHEDGYRALRPNIPLLQLKVGYYLSDMTEPDQGNLVLVPGSHKCAIEPARDQLQSHDTFPGAIQICAPAGSCFMFHNAIWHTSGPWGQPEGKRIILYYAYERPWMVASAEHWAYSRSFYNMLAPQQRKFFHGFVFDPPEMRWG